MSTAYGLAAPLGSEMTPPAWLASQVPLTLLMDLACIEEPTYPAQLGAAFARETAAANA